MLKDMCWGRGEGWAVLTAGRSAGRCAGRAAGGEETYRDGSGRVTVAVGWGAEARF